MIKTYYLTPDKEDTTWFIADPHFGHTNIIKYCRRPFLAIEDMNDFILRNWNSTIKQDDLVFFLGDMAFGRGCRPPRWWLNQLSGRIIYIKGSHDNGIRETSTGLNAKIVLREAIVVTENLKFIAIHAPADISIDWEGWVVHGHHHNYRPKVDPRLKNICVSVELTHYRPVSLRQILELAKG